MGGLGLRRPTSSSSRNDGRAGSLPAFIAVLVSASLVATCASPAPTPAPSAAIPPASPATVPGPSASPGITPLPTATPAPEDWTKLELPVLARVASLEATQAGTGAVAPSTAFRLTSLDGTPIRQLAGRLVSTPKIDLRVTRVTGDTAVLRPAAALRRGEVYRFELVRPDGTAEAAWAVQAAWPLKVVSTVPGDESSDVPRDTGIEITFDQAGVRPADLRSRFSISPRTDGRFEQHGLTFVFVPDKPLKRSALYTVTVGRGLPLPGTGMTLERDAVLRFETTGEQVSRVHMTTAKPLFDAATRERPVLAVMLDSPDDEEGAQAVEWIAVRVHRLPGLRAGLDAWRRVDAAPDWTVRTGTTPVKTASLSEVLGGKVRVHPSAYDSSRNWFRLPTRLRAGWYVVTMTHAGISRQAVLQVTDLAAFSLVTETRTLVWVNDLRTNRAVAGARVSLGAKAFGRTDAEGLAIGRTPAAIAAGAGRGEGSVAVVRSAGHTMFVPIGADYGGRTDDWWHLLTLDRERYRTADTVNVWGVVRDRDTSAVPGSVSVRLAAGDSDGVVPPPVIASATVTPDASGAYLAHLAYTDVPPGEYTVSVMVGKTTVTDAGMSVGAIAKPAWQIEVSVPHRAVVAGTSVPATAVASFYEGTPVAGADLRFENGSGDEEDETPASIAATNADGVATASVVMRMPSGHDGQQSEASIYVRGNEPEEGEISAGVPIAVFASSAVVDAESAVSGTRLVITGAVHDVAFGRYDVPGADLWEVDPRGDPRVGAAISLRVTELIPVVRRTGTRYDFIAKRTVPTYEVDEERKELGTRSATTGADGTFRLPMAVTGGDRSYEVVVVYTDEAGRQARTETTAWVRSAYEYTQPNVASTDLDNEDGEYRVGDTVSVRFTDGIPKPEVRRHLFAVMARGLRSVSVQGGARFSTRFTADLVPNAHIAGVRFTGTGYEVDLYGFSPSLRLEDRSLAVELTPDRERYEPGGRVAVAVRTLDAMGRPVAASVFLRAIDEKLFTMGIVRADSPLDSLYESTGSGLLAVAWSHASLDHPDDGKGDTTGGPGGRSDFRDWLLARLVTTGADGRASIAFDLSDDLTSWRVLGSAVTPGLLAGSGSVTIPVGLPFFAEAIVAPQYLSADRPVIRIRAYGTNLRAGAPVTFKVSSSTLPLAVVTVAGTAFQPVEVALPAMPVGSHRLRIEATTGSGSGLRSDTLTRTFEVVETRAVRSHTGSAELVAGTTVDGGTGLTSLTLVDAGRGRVVPLLQELAATEPFRADSALGAAIARDLLADEFGIPDSPGLPEPDLLAFQPGNGMSMLPYSSEDLELTAMAAFSGDRRVNRDRVRQYLENFVDESEDPLTPDRELYLLLARASIGEASIGEVTAAAARTDLTTAQRVTVALAALALGDEGLARQAYLDLLDRSGERHGPWVRLDTGDAESTAVATARLAIIAAALGDPLAAAMDAEVAAHPPKDTLLDLERAIAAGYWAHRIPKADAVAAVTIDGRRSEIRITADNPAIFTLTPAQRAGLRIDPVSGSVLLISRWDGALAVGDLTPAAGQSFTRTVAPAGVIEPARTVVVSFDVRLGSGTDDGCWRVTDFAPSGLAPISTPGRWEEEGDESGSAAEQPWQVEGQRVDFCVSPDPRRPVQTLRYLARVVTPGTYRWESAVLQSPLVPEQGIVLPPFEVTIGEPGS